jgi:hypothetical protein
MSVISSSSGLDRRNAAPSSTGAAAVENSTPVSLLSSLSALSTTSSSSSWIAELVDLESPLQIAPKAPTKCPIFCCFYAEFDIKRGPVVRYQSPVNFMDQGIGITESEIHDILARTFQNLEKSDKQQPPSNRVVDESTPDLQTTHLAATTISERRADGETAKPLLKSQPISIEQDDSIVSTDRGGVQTVDDHPKIENNNSFQAEGYQSIFDSTSEYIITGSELTGKIITLSTHTMHVMTRPTQIIDERYERNALLFSVGIVLRRAADPRPFRPLISKLAMTLRSMEIESGVLSDPVKVHRIQPLLERVLISLNSPRWECNLLLDRCTALNLKLFHPPKPQASPVHDYHVPVLLRRDLQLQMYEWDLAINWVILHIDGVTTARQISIKAEVDLEMVLACLRVLKHHGVISLVDMFLYSNRYEFTEKAASLLAGKDDKLLQEAAEFALKQPTVQVPLLHSTVPPPLPFRHNAGSNSNSLPGISVGSVGVAAENGSIVSSSGGGASDGGIGGSSRPTSPFFPIATPSSSYPPRNWNPLGGASYRSSSLRSAMMTSGNSLEKEVVPLVGPSARIQHLMRALAELYCGCNRNISFGDLWLSLTSEHQSRQQQQVKHEHSLQQGIRSAGTYHRSVSNRKDSLTDQDISEHESVGFYPVESSLLDPLRNNGVDSYPSAQNASSRIILSSPPKWRDLFGEFDHRRFVTFGVVHGLLLRVHSFPYYSGPSLPERGVFAVTKTGKAMNGRAPVNVSTHHFLKNQLSEEKRYKIAKAVAALMDGTRCDDELVSMFETPFHKLVELVEKYSGVKVMHIYASNSSVGYGQ